MQALLEQIINECRCFTPLGHTATYIPELARVNPDGLGICMISDHEQEYFAGDCHTRFTMQSVVKPMILMLALQSELENYTLDTSKVKAFLVPAGTGVMLHSCALHYCPCHVGGDDKFFRMAVVLPRGTNTDMPRPEPKCAEDQLIWARNKWLIAHPDTSEAANGAFVGLMGENLSV